MQYQPLVTHYCKKFHEAALRRIQGHSVFGASAPFPPLPKGGEGGFA